MAVVLAYVDAVPGRLYPLVATLEELARRGHRVAVRCGIDDVERLRSLGLEVEPLRAEIERFTPDDWRARTRFGALNRGLGQFGERAPFQLADLERAIESVQPDVLFVDEGAWGAAVAAEHSGLPWAYSIVSPVPLPSADVPPFGLGLAPRHDLVGRVRDRLAKRLTLGTLERLIASYVNPLRAALDLQPVRTIEDVYLAASVVLAYTAEPFEYPRSDWPAKVKLVGPGLWEPPADPPGWLDDVQQPFVLVTCSTLFQNDRRLVETACAAFADEPFDVAVTTADVDPSGLDPAANIRIERFLPHDPLLRRAACVVCHAGMGITQKALAHGVPVVAVPFGRDQPEVARRVEVAGAGVRLPVRDLTPARLRRAVNRATDHRAGAERIAAAFAGAGGAPAAADSLEALVSTRSHDTAASAGAPTEVVQSHPGGGAGARTLTLVERHVDGREIVEASDRAAWRRWLAERHRQRDAIWLVFHKNTSNGSSPSYEEAVEEALCFGWIDSTVNRLDERRSLQLFAPRKPRSTWSMSNKERAARLERDGLLAPAGIEAIEVARANGSWTALDAVERLEEPPELAAALDADAAARENWNGFSPSSRKAILWWVTSAKRPETRARRIEQTVRMAAKGLRAQFDRD